MSWCSEKGGRRLRRIAARRMSQHDPPTSDSAPRRRVEMLADRTRAPRSRAGPRPARDGPRLERGDQTADGHGIGGRPRAGPLARLAPLKGAAQSRAPRVPRVAQRTYSISGRASSSGVPGPPQRRSGSDAASASNFRNELRGDGRRLAVSSRVRARSRRSRRPEPGARSGVEMANSMSQQQLSGPSTRQGHRERGSPPGWLRRIGLDRSAACDRCSSATATRAQEPVVDGAHP